jgi:hypothetical protein
VTLPGAPRQPRSCLDRGTRSPTTTPEMKALRRRVWRDQGVASLSVEDIADPLAAPGGHERGHAALGAARRGI